jgi:hypothetical protein
MSGFSESKYCSSEIPSFVIPSQIKNLYHELIPVALAGNTHSIYKETASRLKLDPQAIINELSTVRQHIDEIIQYAQNPNEEIRIRTDAYLMNVLAKMEALGVNLGSLPDSNGAVMSVGTVPELAFNRTYRGLVKIYNDNHTKITNDGLADMANGRVIASINRDLNYSASLSNASDRNYSLPALGESHTAILSTNGNNVSWDPAYYLEPTFNHLVEQSNNARQSLRHNSVLLNTQRLLVDNAVEEIFEPRSAALRREQELASKPNIFRTIGSAFSRLIGRQAAPLRPA